MENNNNNIHNAKYNDTELNGDLKVWFMSLGKDAPEATILSDTNIMKRISNYEKTWKNSRDLYTFTRNEILDMLLMFSSSSPITLNVYLSKIRTYLSLAIEHGYVRTEINLADSIKYEDLMELINKTKRDKKIVGEEGIYKLVEENVINYQDQAILLLMFEGIRGTDCVELEQLKNDDFDPIKSTIKVYREKEIITPDPETGEDKTRIEGKDLVIKIPKRLTNILKLNKEEGEYYKRNGHASKLSLAPETYPLNVDTEYLIKPKYVINLKKGRTNLPYISGRNIQIKAIRVLKNYMDCPFLTPSSLYLSGVIDRLKTLAKELDKKELSHKEVADYLDSRFEKLNTYQTYLAYKSEIAED